MGWINRQSRRDLFGPTKSQTTQPSVGCATTTDVVHPGYRKGPHNLRLLEHAAHHDDGRSSGAAHIRQQLIRHPKKRQHRLSEHDVAHLKFERDGSALPTGINHLLPRPPIDSLPISRILPVAERGRARFEFRNTMRIIWQKSKSVRWCSAGRVLRVAILIGVSGLFQAPRIERARHVRC